MEESRPSFEIRPGEAIGPFALGMTRDEAREVARREFKAEARAWDSTAPERADFMPDLGIVVSYDANGRCVDVEAQFGCAFGNKSTFLFFGNELNWMKDDAVLQLCKDRWPDVAYGFTGIDVPSAGFSAIYYDVPSDGVFCAASVFRAARGQ